MLMDAGSERPLCSGCGAPASGYEALWRIAPDVGAGRTCWLRLGPRDSTLESLWHATCAQVLGVERG
jgi:hypothetical protein